MVGGLGLDKLKELMPDIISTSERTHIHPHVRDGYIMMYIYLPSVFPEEFLQYVGPIIPSVLKVTYFCVTSQENKAKVLVRYQSDYL